MERNFTDENFEDFLRQNADGLRMRPSARVWKGIAGHLNKRRRRTGFILGFSLLLTTGLGYYFASESAENVQNAVARPGSITKQVSNPTTGKVSAHQNNQTNEVVASSGNRKAVVQGNSSTGRIITDVSTGTAMDMSGIGNNLFTSESALIPTIVDSYYEADPNKHIEAGSMEKLQEMDPLTIESIVNSYRQKHKSKLGYQVYFTPTVSYRTLNDNHINNVALHKPDFGFEMGLAVKYPVTKKMKIRAGLQFNVNRYGIRTYNTSTEMATIRLKDRDVVSTATNYNNFSGYRPNWLENFYFQVSSPIGVELNLSGNKNVRFGVASTIQPTYVLGDKAYLISSDYKNYVEVPKLIRHWNVGTSVETFVAYSTGTLKWQVGPQVRYQLLSSFVKTYPVKENLFDFGLKVGISLNNQ